ncbi:hypothetical protein SAMN05421678_109191 [Actinopolymorpha cephalotaxi]|uniref:Universal stress protein family protein n=1 Tax=Actinopolymorpha cephalotaxi TaxID=504797 RepID=A0A1I2VL44_9ACTN|nr:hypothetical protein [Actinopolymorpha cephalotaxi]NYH83316.1 hypothetical protein [Actinopolymorpha cephalotaxi]SFG88957.1 hypothetical protein SAMN05421678_109191 [Actinopolymorpha cephalotaxi]
MIGPGGALTGAVVVGASEGASAHGAVGWAALAARARRLPLVVCHAYQTGGDAPGGDNELHCAARNRAWRTARDGVRQASAAAPGVRAVPWVLEGSVAQVLVGAVPDPEFLVVGVRGEGRQAAELVASFGQWGGAFGPCPVVAVPARKRGLTRRPRRHRRGPRRGVAGRVVVAAEGGRSADEVRRFAREEALAWGSEVREVPMAAFARSSPAGCESLSAAAQDADLLVVGRPGDENAGIGVGGPVVAYSGATGEVAEPPPAASLARVLGPGLLRGLGSPIAVVPVRERDLVGGPRPRRPRSERGDRGERGGHPGAHLAEHWGTALVTAPGERGTG